MMDKPVSMQVRLHLRACNDPQGVEMPLLAIVVGAQQYAEEYELELGCKIGDDFVLGPHWAEVLSNFIGLLNGPTGRLDCGILDTQARTLAKMHNWNEEL